MRRWGWILGVILLILVRSTSETRLEQLHPAELLYLYIEDGQLILETDNGDRGKGKTAAETKADLEATTAGIVLLDTADYIVIDQQAWSYLEDIGKDLRPAAEVCAGSGKIDVKTAAAYLCQHPPGITILDYRTGRKEIKTLFCREGRYSYGREADRSSANAVETRCTGSSGDACSSWVQLDNGGGDRSNLSSASAGERQCGG